MLSSDSGVPQEVFFQWLAVAHHKLQRRRDSKYKFVRGAERNGEGKKQGQITCREREREREREMEREAATD